MKKTIMTTAAAMMCSLCVAANYSINAQGQKTVNVETDVSYIITSQNLTLYVDGDATGSGTGTNWTDAYTTIQAAWDGLPSIIAHDVEIICRAASAPYREEVALTGRVVLPKTAATWPTYPGERVLIRGEHYAYGDCEANAGGAGEITDTAAFGDIAVGDTVFVLDLTGASGLCQSYEVGTVDDIANAPNRIGTTLSATPTTDWKYTVVRTEISGSDNGIDGGTARDFGFQVSGINNVTVMGLLISFQDSCGVSVQDSRRIGIYGCYFKSCDNNGVYTARKSETTVTHCGSYGAGETNAAHHSYLATGTSMLYARYVFGLADPGDGSCFLAGDGSMAFLLNSYVIDGQAGLQAENNSQIWALYTTIGNGDSAAGARVLDDSIVRFTSGANLEGTPSNLTEDSQYVTN